ncbi:conserved hypothetical protein [Perkinsus marinus ATCC 50983]|uniref:Uncharacterized protein n=1 Tax=Perkinsus marinus (strain ATCC 50983 / TXsc) TaxID=423536 RepID=C5L3I5_PERM5|nr:conserved hypothetical protein [Perkinsus marinus ATCC 50983]EER08564.1 conserved hypothetical protein [Perkinsus marinus ATCC 50983]|eukprot:XP_002776748.1 conserved hypothetical protein [Perkinsus marinus ATCC 50983]
MAPLSDVVFNTGLVGYPDSSTDPSFWWLVQSAGIRGPAGGAITMVLSDDLDHPGPLRNFEGGRCHVKGLVISGSGIARHTLSERFRRLDRPMRGQAEC